MKGLIKAFIHPVYQACKYQQGLVPSSVCVLTQLLGLIDELSRAFHKQLVQRLLDRLVRFGRRSATHRPVTENVRELTFCPGPHSGPGFGSCS